MVIFCIATGFFLPEKSMFHSKTEIVSLSAAILPSTMATYSPVSRGSSSLSIQLLPRRVAVAAGAAYWVPSAQAPGHTGGSVIAALRPHAVKEMIHVHLNGEFYHFLDKQLENNSVSSVLQWLLCVIKRRDPGAHKGFEIYTDRHRAPSSSLLFTYRALLFSK